MVTLQIRDVPEDIRDILAERARQNGQSLQAFLLSLVIREASISQNLGLLSEMEGWASGSDVTADDVLAARNAGRTERNPARRS
jgi:antitoxin FitA